MIGLRNVATRAFIQSQRVTSSIGAPFHAGSILSSDKKVLNLVAIHNFGSFQLLKDSDTMSMAKKVNPREAAAKKAAEEATRRALEKRKLEQEKEKEKEKEK